ncbi:pentatricopeptide repeat-containing protein At2g22410, mitochondrial-like [Silene latifolia]|uniref:pentatricopeptide repeat-containing protein At2g22410, mitochondrial-like n=1 Tax=Silene latifolia TaxID=37657 RepID=UPI003D772BB4
MINNIINNPKSKLLSLTIVNYIHTRSLAPYKSKPNNWNTKHTFVKSNPLLNLLEKCTCMSQLYQIQAQMITTGLFLDGFASSRLIAFCAVSEAGDLSYCDRILRVVQNPNVFSWNVAIRGYSESLIPVKAMVLYREMLVSGLCRPDNFTYPMLFKACARLCSCLMGYMVFGHVLKLGFECDVFVHNGVVHMLVSCGRLEDARRVFDESCVRDLVTWNSLINGYVHCGKPCEALNLFEEMKLNGVKPDEVTMIGMVASCAQLMDLDRGVEFHQLIWEYGLDFTVPLCNTLMDMYSKCGDAKAAKVIFDSMRKKTSVSWTTMVLGYAKVGMLDEARKLFDEMDNKDTVPWNAMIGAYVEAMRSKEALILFKNMLGANILPDKVTMLHCLTACSQLGALDAGIWIHGYINNAMLPLNVSLGTALVDMYAKCGNIEKALKVFQELPVKNSLTWTSIIGGLAFHGFANDALSHFEKMVESGLKPDEITFLGVLAACCHGGLVNEGRNYFDQMTSTYNLTPKTKHYSSMVDLLGRAGKLEEAEALIMSMPMEPGAIVWGALFFACRMHGNVKMGEKAALKLLELDPEDSGIYVMLASMYGDAGMWDEARKVRKMMKQRGVDKTLGCSSIEINGIVSEFTVRDETHPPSEQIHECVALLTKQLE